MTKVSIIIPLYNREELIIETLRSVECQTLVDFECLIIDDHSTDNSYDRVVQFSKVDPRFKVWKRKSAVRGACACRNEGIESCIGDFVMFLDSDDVLRTNCLQTRIDKLSTRPELDFLVNQIATFQHETGKATHLWNSLLHTDELLAFVDGEGWQTSSTLFRLAFVKQFRFDESALSYQDVDFHLRILLTKPVYEKYHEAPPDAFIRISRFDRISTGNISYERIRSRILIYRKLESIMEEKNFTGYRFPYMMYNVKYLEIAARLLTWSEFEQLYSLWKGSITHQLASRRMIYIPYLFLQSYLKRVGARVPSAVCYRIFRVISSRRLLRGGHRAVPLLSAINVSEVSCYKAMPWV